MSRARKKGTEGENFFLGPLRQTFTGLQIERAPLKGTLDWGDYTGVPWLHEAKNTERPLFLEWARKASRKAASWRWAVLWKGDLRKPDTGPYVLITLDFYRELVEAAHGEVWT